jgi:translation initiation factor 2 subunit 1
LKKTEWPQTGSLVVVKIKRIMPYGAIAELSEYPGKEGFIHISNVATSWVKNIHSFISEGNIRVAQVNALDLAKRSIDLSLRKVSGQQEKRKLEDWKREKRADKLFERVCHEIKEDVRQSQATVGAKLEEQFGDLLSAFENASSAGEEVLKPLGLSEKWVKALVKCAKDNVTISEVTVKGDLTLTTRKGDGMNAIRAALAAAAKPGVRIEYISAPRYRVNVTGQDYGQAEKLLASATEAAIKVMQKQGGEGSFEKIKA